MILLDQNLLEKLAQEFEKELGIPLFFQEQEQYESKCVLLQFSLIYQNTGLTNCDVNKKQVPCHLSIILTVQDYAIPHDGKKIFFAGIEAIKFFTSRYGIKGGIQNSLEKIKPNNPDLLVQEFGFNLKRIFYIDLNSSTEEKED